MPPDACWRGRNECEEQENDEARDRPSSHCPLEIRRLHARLEKLLSRQFRKFSSCRLQRRLRRHVPLHFDVMPSCIGFSRRHESVEECFEPRAIFRFDGHCQGFNLFLGRALIVKFGQLLVLVSIDGQGIFMQSNGSPQNVPAIFGLFEFPYLRDLGLKRGYLIVYYLLSLHRRRCARLAVRKFYGRTFQFPLQTSPGKSVHEIGIQNSNVELGFRCGGIAGRKKAAAGDEQKEPQNFLHRVIYMIVAQRWHEFFAGRIGTRLRCIR